MSLYVTDMNARRVCFFCGLLVLLLLTIHQFFGNFDYSQFYLVPMRNTELQKNLMLQNKLLDMSPNQTSTLEDIINLQRKKIALEMSDYKYPEGKFGVKAEKLSDLTMETGGTPLRNVIITTWRSGSTFLGDILNAIPGTFYHYEPLSDFDLVQIRGPPNATVALRSLKKFLDCDYRDMNEYLNFVQGHNWVFKHNKRLWSHCQNFTEAFWNPTFLSRFCKLFPIQSMKVVHIRLKLVEELLGEDSSGPRILLLVRDPRGLMQSRRVWENCIGHPDWDEPGLVCEDMVANYDAAVHMAAAYPQRFRVVRYEDLCLNPQETVSSLLEFFGLDFHWLVMDFLNTHTKTEDDRIYSTFRNSETVAFHWITEMDFDDVWIVQNECAEAMAHWGYNKADNRSHLLSKEFHPLGDYSIV